MKKVSIIIPVYNTGEYLHDCIESIISQTYRDLQIILIDDGSTDNSGDICDLYAQKDSRIIVKHKKNAGVSAARNSGLDLADGDYIAFFDSDDTVLPNMIEDLVNTALEYNVDIVQTAGPLMANISETGNVIVLNKNNVLDENFSFSDYYKPSLWLGIYRAELFDEIRFPNDIHFYEDFTVLTLLAAKADKVAFVDRRYYNYIQREGSANHSGLTSKKKSAINIPSYLEGKGIYRNSQDRRNTYSFFIVGRFISTLTSYNAEVYDYKFIKAIIRQHFIDILFAKAPKLSLRAICIIYILFPKIVKRFVVHKLGIKK